MGATSSQISFTGRSSRPRGARTSWTRTARTTSSLRAELERLLGANDRAGGFIRVPVVVARRSGRTGARRRPAHRRVPAGEGDRTRRHGRRCTWPNERTVGFSQRSRSSSSSGAWTPTRCWRASAPSARSSPRSTIPTSRGFSTGEHRRRAPLLRRWSTSTVSRSTRSPRHGFRCVDRLRMFLQVCDAVAYAHTQGVIHRDIKPLNTLVTPSGVPKLLDFGIAKVLGDGADEVTSTVTGIRLLTPEYASPEQIEGTSRHRGERRLFPRRGALRAAHRPVALSARQSGAAGCRGRGMHHRTRSPEQRGDSRARVADGGVRRTSGAGGPCRARGRAAPGS